MWRFAELILGEGNSHRWGKRGKTAYPGVITPVDHVTAQEAAILNASDSISITALDELYRKQYGMMCKHSCIKGRKATRNAPKSSVVELSEKGNAESSFSLSGIVNRIRAENLDCVAELKKYINVSEVAV